MRGSGTFQRITRETIDEHIATVRGMYLEALGQKPPPRPKMVKRTASGDTE